MATNVITPGNSQTTQLADLDANAVLLVTEGGYIVSSKTGYPAYYANGGGANVTVKGTLMCSGGIGALYLGQNESSTAGGGNIVDISSSGLVEGLSGISIFGGGNSITNAGDIRGTGTSDPNGPDNVSGNKPGGIYELGDNNYVANSGTIEGFYGILSKGSNTTIVNSGTITSTSTFAVYATGTLTLKNSGTVEGEIADEDGAATALTNTGTIDGFVFVSGGSTIENYGSMTQECESSGSNNLITNYGKMYSFVGDGGGDYFDNEAGGTILSLTLGGAGSTVADSVNNAGTLGIVTLQNVAANQFTNTGVVEDAVTASNGNNLIENYGQIDGAVTTHAGADTIENFGTIASVYSGGGGDTLINGSDGVILGQVLLGVTDSAAATFTNDGTVGVDLTASNEPTVYFGAGADTLTNDGKLYGYVMMGDGDDTVDTSLGTIYGKVDLGAGNDSYTGGDGIDRVIGGAGNDTIDLGAGNDIYYAIDNDGNDTIEGGDGIDTYNASAATKSVTIDLESGVATGATIGTDSIFDFERIVGSSVGDKLTGSDAANYIDGGGGNDSIFGGSGIDHLIGGIGSDTITAGTGRDFMTGGTLAGSTESDTFVFADGTSGATAGTRDVITDFTDHGSASAPYATGADTIDLRQIDANTAVAGDQAFSFNATKGAAFSGAAGSLIWQQYSGYALVSGDTNGDGKADFTLQLNGTHTLYASDFKL